MARERVEKLIPLDHEFMSLEQPQSAAVLQFSPSIQKEREFWVRMENIEVEANCASIAEEARRDGF